MQERRVTRTQHVIYYGTVCFGVLVCVWWIEGPVGGVASKTGAMTLSGRIRRGSPVIGLARQDESRIGSPEIIGRYKMHVYALARESSVNHFGQV